MATEDKPEINTHVQTRSKFFLVMSGVLLATVLIGFSPTLYLRAYFEPREIPSYLYVHGTVLTAWFLLFLVQTSLVASIRTDVHRRLAACGKSRPFESSLR